MARVHSVARRPLPAHPKLVHTCADLRDAAARDALGGVDVLWHLAFVLWRDPSAAVVNRDGTDNVLAARPARVVFASSAAVYGARPDNPLPLHEHHAARPNPECAYATHKLDAERRCLDAGPPALVLRIGAVLGPHADPRLRRATRGYRRVVPAIGGVRQATQFLDEDDVADALLRAGRTPATGVLNVATTDWLDAEDIARIARSRVVRLPRRLIVGGSEVAYRAHLLPFGADRTVLIDGPLALDARRASVELDWRPTHSSADVLAGALGD